MNKTTPRGWGALPRLACSLALPQVSASLKVTLCRYFDDRALTVLMAHNLSVRFNAALARRQGVSDADGFLDLALDFWFYALVPLGFVLADLVHNTLLGAWAFIGTGSSFLAFAALRP